ncbi:unnamed protein product [Lepidochelys kempii]
MRPVHQSKKSSLVPPVVKGRMARRASPCHTRTGTQKRLGSRDLGWGHLGEERGRVPRGGGRGKAGLYLQLRPVVETRYEEIIATIKGLLQADIIRPTMSAFNSPIWPVHKKDGTWRMTVNYRNLNRVTPILTVAVPDMVSIMERFVMQVGQWHVMVDLANAFFSIAIAPQSQDQFAFTWKDRQYTFTVLPQGYKHSPTICHQLVSRDLEQVTLPEGVVTGALY